MITSTSPGLLRAGVIAVNWFEENCKILASIAPIVTVSSTPKISFMNPVPVILICVPPAILPLGGEILVMFGKGL